MRPKSKYSIFMLVLIGLFVALAVATAVMAYIEKRKRSSFDSALAVQMAQLVNMYGRIPFPSDENIEATRTNVTTLSKGLSDLINAMASGQITVTNVIQPLDWLSLLKKAQVGLRDRAKKAGIEVPPKCSFGFEDYDNGVPPKKAEHIERLTAQLIMVDRICSLMYECGIKQLVGVERQQFENSAAGEFPDVGGGIPTNTALCLFSKEHFRFVVKGKEQAILAILNACASNRLFIVVTEVEIAGATGVAKLKTDASPKGTAGYAGDRRMAGREWSADVDSTDQEEGAAIDSRPKDERVISGRGLEESSAVKIDMEIYSFRMPSRKDGRK